MNASIARRISDLIWRDLSLRAGFREVIDSIPRSNYEIVDFWTQRIEEVIGDDRLIAALEKIRDTDCRGNRHESAYIAMRALGPLHAEQAAAAGVTQYVADGTAHRTEQLSLGVRLTGEPQFQRLTIEQMEKLGEQEAARRATVEQKDEEVADI